MGRIIIVYGVIAGLIVAGLMHLTFWLLPVEGGPLGMFIGFLSMFIAFSMILVGVKQHRDQAGGGVISFRRGLLVGLGIALIASVFYVLAWELYLALSGVDFIGDYYARALAEAQESGASAARLAEIRAEAAVWTERYANPLLRMAITLTEIIWVGVLVAVVTALLLRNPRFLPAREARAATSG